ncbi:nucleoside phosphorylase [Kordia sp. YSTF-M3]|uniref:Uridine phosphorylase n=1 Tax=Kordia aestuariivivens TaxID=2759037 RepID=A0ABR7Q968_9FLAO|nr:nucleoside phosphorylase [Kordia aestuariivivens]MBC8755077.1 nucleoside phosphorylase [Kordia aestuariivivens]
MSNIAASELIINPDGSIYHLNLLPEDIASTVIVVGDPDRVSAVSKYFDTIEVKKAKREFVTHTGTLKGKRITVLSTGIGTDNIDIVFNELDALVNVDFKKRQVKSTLTQLDIIRIGTSGSIQVDVPLDSFVISELAIGFDSLLHFYESDHVLNTEIAEAFVKQTEWSPKKSIPYVVKGNPALIDQLSSEQTIAGFTATNVGFYGPQSRKIRLNVQDEQLNDKLANFNHQDKKITNLEMETAGIYGLANLLGHRAISMNAIIANRPLGQFSKAPKQTVDTLIQYTLGKLV